MKKIISVILVAALAFGMFIFPETALAADEYWTDGLTANPDATFDGGEGSSLTPYLINSETALAQLAVNVNSGITYQDESGEKYFRLDKNLDLSGKFWMPIGLYVKAGVAQNRPFKGTFDGNQYVISNLTVNEPDLEGAGLFGYTRDALIESLGVQNCDITGEGVAGGLVGYARTDTSIHNSYTTGSVKIAENDGYFASYNGAYAGGLVGLYGDSPSTIDGCYSSADVDGDDSVGGLVGAVDNARVINSYATGNVGALTSEAYPAGGFVGFCEEARIEQCYAAGSVTGTGEVGGFVGSTSPNGSGSVITNCFARGNVTTTHDWGWCAGSFAGSVSGITFNNCYGTGSVNYTAADEAYHIGGFVGEKYFDWSVVQFNNCFFDQTVAGREAIGNDDDAGSSPETGITGLITANMQGYNTLLSDSKMDELDSSEGEPESGTPVWYPHSTDYPDFEPEPCTITFDSQSADTEASPTSKTATLGYAIGTLPSDPVKDQHIFCGWYTEIKGGGTKIATTDAAPGTINVYAKWVSMLKLTPSNSNGKIEIGKSITLTPNIDGGTWTFDSAYLSRSGNTFMGNKAGTTRVTYTVEDQSAGYDIAITQANAVGISCTKTDVSLYAGFNGTITLTASGGDSGTYEYSLNGGAWQSANVFSGLKAGTYTAAVRDAANTVNSASCNVAVGQPSHLGNIPAKKLSSKANAGTAITLTPLAAPRGYTLVSVTYTSSKPAVAAVDASGNVTFLAGGKTVITAKSVYQMTDSKGKVKTKTTTVKKTVTVKQLVATVSLSKTDATVMRTQKVKLTAAIVPTTASRKSVTWKSSNTKVASVSSSGVVTGKSAGTAVITCTAKDGSGITASCTVTVTPITVTGLRLSKAALTVRAGRSYSLRATVLPRNTDFKTVTWQSSNPAVATVSAKGKVKGIAPGTVTITATANNGMTASCTVTVK